VFFFFFCLDSPVLPGVYRSLSFLPQKRFVNLSAPPPFSKKFLFFLRIMEANHAHCFFFFWSITEKIFFSPPSPFFFSFSRDVGYPPPRYRPSVANVFPPLLPDAPHVAFGPAFSLFRSRFAVAPFSFVQARGPRSETPFQAFFHQGTEMEGGHRSPFTQT